MKKPIAKIGDVVVIKQEAFRLSKGEDPQLIQAIVREASYLKHDYADWQYLVEFYDDDGKNEFFISTDNIVYNLSTHALSQLQSRIKRKR